MYDLDGRPSGGRVEDVLRIVALSERSDQPVRTLPSGMKRRVGSAGRNV